MKPHAAHRHSPRPDRLLREVTAACDSRGLRLTPLRRQVLELIAASDKPVKAYDLLHRLRADHDSAAPPTVYRALDFLIEHGFIHKLESVNAYTSCHHPSEPHTVPFFICDLCSAATEFCDERVANLLVDHAQQLGFEPAGQTLEVHGVCRQCRERDGAPLPA